VPSVSLRVMNSDARLPTLLDELAIAKLPDSSAEKISPMTDSKRF
jgi:hypothetical protein